jgi:hypothetical protein
VRSIRKRHCSTQTLRPKPPRPMRRWKTRVRRCGLGYVSTIITVQLTMTEADKALRQVERGECVALPRYAKTNAAEACWGRAEQPLRQCPAAHHPYIEPCSHHADLVSGRDHTGMTISITFAICSNAGSSLQLNLHVGDVGRCDDRRSRGRKWSCSRCLLCSSGAMSTRVFIFDRAAQPGRLS